MSNNINSIKKFSENKDQILLINQLSEEVDIFYLNCLKFFFNLRSVSISMGTAHAKENIINDLFNNSTVDLYFTIKKNELDKIMNGNTKSIIFTNYANCKNYSSENFTIINSYKYIDDINFLISDIFKINNIRLLEYGYREPHMFFSELIKIQINGNGYSAPNINEANNEIMEIRKKLFNLKKNNIDIKEIYSEIKKEASSKKFNFLTY